MKIFLNIEIGEHDTPRLEALLSALSGGKAVVTTTGTLEPREAGDNSGPAGTETAAKTETKPVAKKSAGKKGRGISDNPDDRKEDDAATQAQDADDEKAETEAGVSEEKLTVEDLRAAMGDYVKNFGMPATQEDGPKIFSSALGNPPEGDEFWKASIVAAAGDEAIAKAVTAWRAAAASEVRFGV